MTTTAMSPQLFSGDLRPFPGIPEEWPTAKRRVAALVLADIEAFAPDMLGPVVAGADSEDFWEDAARISAAWHASGKRLIAKPGGTFNQPWTSAEMALRFGPVMRDEEGGHHAHDSFINHPVVQKHGGRAMFLGSIGGTPANDITTWLARRHRDHAVKRGVVKSTAHKNGIWSIELSHDPAVIRERLLEEMDWSFIRLEETPDAVFAQEEIRMTYEYRLFIVDGEIVSGAGCVEEFTPLDNLTGRAFDTRVRRVRGHLEQGAASEVEDRPDIARTLIGFGRRVAKQFGRTAAIDVAIDDATGKPVVIELNGMPNSGLYASNPWFVAEKLVNATDRGYQL